MKELDLQYFTGNSVTCHKDGHMTTFSASPNSSVDKDTEVALTITPASGYEVDEIEVIAGGPLTLTPTESGAKFSMPNEAVILYCKSKANNKYMVTESVDVTINGSKTRLVRNMKLLTAANGAIIGVDVTGTAVTLDAGTVAELVKAGTLVKI